MSKWCIDKRIAITTAITLLILVSSYAYTFFQYVWSEALSPFRSLFPFYACLFLLYLLLFIFTLCMKRFVWAGAFFLALVLVMGGIKLEGRITSPLPLARVAQSELRYQACENSAKAAGKVVDVCESVTNLSSNSEYRNVQSIVYDGNGELTFPEYQRSAIWEKQALSTGLPLDRDSARIVPLRDHLFFVEWVF
jgi:hypothetical protein